MPSSKKQIRVVAAVVQQNGNYLITQRRASAVFPLRWEFPGGKVEQGETDESALKRELKERLGAQFAVGAKLGERVHKYPQQEVVFVLYAATLEPNQTPEPKRVNDVRFVHPSDFGHYHFIDADQETMEELLGLDK